MLWNTPGTRARGPAECAASTEIRMARNQARRVPWLKCGLQCRSAHQRSDNAAAWTWHRGGGQASNRRRPLRGARACGAADSTFCGRVERRPGGRFGVRFVTTGPRGAVLEYPRGAVLEYPSGSALAYPGGSALGFGVCGWARRAFLDGRAKGNEPDECRLRDELHDLCERVLQTWATQRSRSSTRLSA